MLSYWLMETDLSDQTPEIPGGVAYGLIDDDNPAPVDAVIYEGDNALEQVEKAAAEITTRQADAAVAALTKGNNGKGKR